MAILQMHYLFETKWFAKEQSFKQLFYRTIVQLVARSKKEIVDKIIDALMQIQGGYALKLLLMGLYRCKRSIRCPMVLGKYQNSFVLASETCALDIIGAKFIRQFENGEVVVINDKKIKSRYPYPKSNKGRVFLNTSIFLALIVY